MIKMQCGIRIILSRLTINKYFTPLISIPFLSF